MGKTMPSLRIAVAVLFVSIFVPAMIAAPPPQDVNVVNRPNVTVTNSVQLAAGAMVKIDATTEVAYNHMFFAQPVAQVSDPIDVSHFKQIRVVAITQGQFTSATIKPLFMLPDGVTSIPLDDDIMVEKPGINVVNRLYDLPGTTLKFSVETHSPSTQVRIVVYGRAN